MVSVFLVSWTVFQVRGPGPIPGLELVTGAGPGGTSVCGASARLLATNFVRAASIGYANNQKALG